MPIVHNNIKGLYMRLCCRRRFIRSLLITYIILYIYIYNYIILYNKILLLIIILSNLKNRKDSTKDKDSINEMHNINKVQNYSIKPHRNSIDVKAEVPVILSKDTVPVLVTSTVHIENNIEKVLSIKSRPKINNYTIIKGEYGDLHLFVSGTVYTTIDYAADKQQDHKVKYATQRNTFKFSRKVSTDKLLNNNPLNMSIEKVDIYSNLKNNSEDPLLCIDMKLYFNINQKQIVNLYSIPY